MILFEFFSAFTKGKKFAFQAMHSLNTDMAISQPSTLKKSKEVQKNISARLFMPSMHDIMLKVP